MRKISIFFILGIFLISTISSSSYIDFSIKAEIEGSVDEGDSFVIEVELENIDEDDIEDCKIFLSGYSGWAELEDYFDEEFELEAGDKIDFEIELEAKQDSKGTNDIDIGVECDGATEEIISLPVKVYEKVVEEDCTPNWECGVWEYCENGRISRNCTDGCGESRVEYERCSIAGEKETENLQIPNWDCEEGGMCSHGKRIIR